MTERIDMKKGQVYEGIIESVEFPNKGRIYLPEEDKKDWRQQERLQLLVKRHL